MGNTPSSPPQAPSPPDIAANIPPLPPPCDLTCQKQKQLTTLKQKLDSIDPEQDPSGYEKARIAYFTVLNGPGWLAQEKGRIAKEDVEPVLSSYTTRFNALKGEQQSQSIFTNLASSLTAQESSDEESNRFLKQQLTKEKDKAAVTDRLNQLTDSTPEPSSYLTWAVDILITILGLFVLYKLYTRFMGQVTMSPSVPDLSSV